MSAALPIAAAATSALAAAVVTVALVAVRRRESALAAVAGETEPDEQITRAEENLTISVVQAAGRCGFHLEPWQESMLRRHMTAGATHPDLVFLSPDGES